MEISLNEPSAPQADGANVTAGGLGLELPVELPLELPLDLPPVPASAPVDGGVFSLGDDFTGVSDLSLELTPPPTDTTDLPGQNHLVQAEGTSGGAEGPDENSGVERFKINSIDLGSVSDGDTGQSQNSLQENSLNLESLDPTGVSVPLVELSMEEASAEVPSPLELKLVPEPPSSLRVQGDSAPSLPAIDWRTMLRGRNVGPEIMPQLLGQAFASELEKHVAIQAMALMAGSCEQLSEWHWRVWRYPREYGYQLSGKERYPSGTSSKILGSHLHKLVTLLAPLLVRAYPEKFNLENVAARLRQTVQQVEKSRRLVKWDSGILAVVGLSLFKDRLNAHRYHAFHVSGLGKQIFYEGRTRSVHFDEQYWQGRPPSHLFHRILGILRSVRLHYFVPLELDPIRDVMPIVNDLKSTWEANGISRLKFGLGIAKNRVSKYLDVVDENQLRPIIDKMGPPQYDHFIKLWDAMNEHLCRLIVAETLDVVGMFETLTDRDLTAPGSLKQGEILQLTPLAPGLFDFISKLKV